MASAGSTLSKVIMGTGAIIDSPATQSIIPLTKRAGLSLKRSMRGRPQSAMTLVTRLIMRSSILLKRSFNSLFASQAGNGNGLPLNSPNAIRTQKAPTTEAMPGSAIGKRSGVASRLNQTTRCRLL